MINLLLLPVLLPKRQMDTQKDAHRIEKSVDRNSFFFLILKEQKIMMKNRIFGSCHVSHNYFMTNFSNHSPGIFSTIS